MKRSALGKGLDSLISMDDIQTEGSSAINEIPISQITPNPDQPRQNFDEVALEELATSIRELGIIQPLTLRSMGDNSYQIISGERRYRAALLAGLDSVPAYIRTANDSEVTEMALIENIQREDLDAIEIALTFRKLIDQYELTQERLSERIGKKRATIANFLRLLKLPAEVQLGLRDHTVDMGQEEVFMAILAFHFVIFDIDAVGCCNVESFIGDQVMGTEAAAKPAAGCRHRHLVFRHGLDLIVLFDGIHFLILLPCWRCLFNVSGASFLLTPLYTQRRREMAAGLGRRLEFIFRRVRRLP